MQNIELGKPLYNLEVYGLLNLDNVLLAEVHLQNGVAAVAYDPAHG